MTQIDGDGRVSLRPPGPGDQDEFIAQARASAGLHHPWYSMPATREEFQAYLAKLSQPTTEGAAYRSAGTASAPTAPPVRSHTA
jgi:[ribosomal protein S5]-alanine N-acetyltransferase